jgi:hypothetical protein
MSTQIDSLLTRLATLGHVLQSQERPFIVGRSLVVGGAQKRLPAGLPQKGHGLFPHSALERVMGEPFDVFGESVRIEMLDGLNDFGVEGTPSLLRKTPIGDLVREGVLERVFELRKEARFVEELGGLQAGEATVERQPGPFSDGLEEREGDIFTNDGGRLEQTLFLW